MLRTSCVPSPLRAGQSHMAFTRLIGWLASPLPLAGEADALEERGGWGLSPHRESQCGGTPTPTLPRKRERERSADVAAPWPSYAIALPLAGSRRAKLALVAHGSRLRFRSLNHVHRSRHLATALRRTLAAVRRARSFIANSSPPAASHCSQRIHQSGAPSWSRRGLRSGSGSQPRCGHLQPLRQRPPCWSNGGLRRAPSR
jgi:hypothetical protein